ncbi:MAG: OmpA family protein, partial [Acidobacteria bacterium]|nr:OmpA family protein [Acidobacteriota bacterium]
TPGTFFGPVVITDRPVYFNDLPFYGPATFNPATLTYSPEPTANGLGNVTLGTKVKLWEGGSRHHAISIAGILRLPTTTSFRGLSSGRGTGEIDFGPILIYGTQYAGGRIRLNTNLGYIHSGDPSNGDVKYLDRRNQLMANAALEGAPNEHLVVFAEWNNVVYVGNGTPNLNPVNPMDVFLGGRAFLKEGRIQFGGGWRRFINPLSNRFVTALVPGGGTALLPLQSGDHNGFTFSFGFGRRLHKTVPPPVNAPPTVALDADKPCVPSGGNINFTARGSDPDNDVLIYTWSTSAGKLTGSGADTVLDTTGLNERPGSAQVDVTVGVTVDDGRGGVATASRRVCVTAPDAPPPAKNRAPRIQSVRCMVVGTPQVEGRVTDGESVRVMVTATDPDGDPLQYSYSTNAGRLSGRGSEEILDTAGVTSGPGGQPVPVTVSVVVNDGRGGSDLGSCTVTVYALGKPEAERLGGGREIRFRRNDARVDNVAKAVLDDVALRLQQDPRATAVLDGHTEKGEPASLGLRRAENAKRYLVRDRHVDATRIAVRNFGAEGADAASRDGQNRRVDVWIVPQGAELPPGPVSAPRRSQ